jgi:hypothetical protein
MMKVMIMIAIENGDDDNNEYDYDGDDKISFEIRTVEALVAVVHR